jgi:hypothetical protein
MNIVREIMWSTAALAVLISSTGYKNGIHGLGGD